ncbi:uncharacterized protein Z518_04701 [Rhinocladiella mackenziei CBS 650.93]|uniref:VOC domain-containing protein n=1 Tax=Rhinocladiella mackenziei CBS 650.93 TaxID=1442369 RepID=A0A0D2JC99_9EURO|nr:uncharacterized protein Z518_04701 [Rhinocladiella mackenziei CBS 650.93]KIX06725.1 hypothetical protein Z518_04701 [Rhinocladiella mackenziei CBS 650.93]
MAAAENLVGIFAVHQNTPNLEKQLALYGHVGFIIDEDADVEGGQSLPDSWFAARGVSRSALNQSVAMKLPDDPFMHVWFYSWNKISSKAQWPPVFNQIGSCCLTLLVDDAQKEIARIQRDFSSLEILQAPEVIPRKWGPTTTTLLRDPEGNFLEIISIEGSPHVEAATPPSNDRTSFLHFMVNCLNFAEMTKFYQSFGMSHDHGVDFRPEVGWPDGLEYFQNQYKQGFGAWPQWGRCDFLRGKRDPSHMHLELLESLEDLKLPGLEPTWAQRGIARYCIKVPDFEAAVRGVKQRRNKIYVERQKGAAPSLIVPLPFTISFNQQHRTMFTDGRMPKLG